MMGENQLSARVRSTTAEGIEEFSADRDMEMTEAERALVNEGLASFGYAETPTTGAEILLYYVRRIGLVLGFVGLILIGYGIFGSRLFSYAGFGLLFTGFVMVAVEGFLRDYGGEQEVKAP